MLPRVLESEVMDSQADAVAYDTMDHGEVNRIFVRDLLALYPDLSCVLDLGAGTAQIPLELLDQRPDAAVVALDAAWSMLELANVNDRRRQRGGLLQCVLADSKRLPFADGTFSAVISNSLLHHLPHPELAVREALRVCRPGGLCFFRDLLRPGELGELNHLVELYAAQCDQQQRQLFADSLHAALTLDELRSLLAGLGCSPDEVTATSDRHWTWVGRC